MVSESGSTQAAARELGISPKLLYRWQQARVVAEFGSVEVAHDTEVRALRALNKRLAQELDILKKGLVIFGQPPRGAPTNTLLTGRPGCPYVSSATPCAPRTARSTLGTGSRAG